ncbi:MAG: VTT domain-containing protein [Candidatus Thorarchaeota archaeon]|nr:VTT domain-containing protein [Candidatus Thorarchaeota archaeon]
MKRIDQFFLIAIIGIILYWMVILIFADLTGPLVAIYYWIQGLSVLIGYPGALLISFIGNVTVLFPFPYIAVLFLLGGAGAGPLGPFYFNPWLLGLFGGVGATIGEMTGYLLGRVGSSYVRTEQTSGFLKFVQKYPRTTPLVLWFLAVTPVPDDVLVIPLGIAKYPWKRVLIPQFVGKTMFLMGIAWAGRLGLSWLESILIGDPTNPITKSIEVIALLLLVIGIYLVLRLNWVKIIERLSLGSNQAPQKEMSE